MVQGTVSAYTACFDKPDPNDAYQIVGYQEYALALNYLVPLVQNADKEDLEAYDAVIQVMDELAIYVNLSRRYDLTKWNPPTPSPDSQQAIQEFRLSSLNETVAFEGDNYQRRGLGWIMALARLEHGAVEVGYQQNKNPFALEKLTVIEREPLAELLLDAVRSHFWAMKVEPQANWVRHGRLTRISDRTALAYGRRSVMVQAMLESLFSIAGDKLAPVQLQELQNWYEQMNRMQRGVSFVIYETAKEAISRQGYDAWSADLKGCKRLVDGIKNDIRQGNAQISISGK